MMATRPLYLCLSEQPLMCWVVVWAWALRSRRMAASQGCLLLLQRCLWALVARRMTASQDRLLVLQCCHWMLVARLQTSASEDWTARMERASLDCPRRRYCGARMLVSLAWLQGRSGPTFPWPQHGPGGHGPHTCTTHCLKFCTGWRRTCESGIDGLAVDVGVHHYWKELGRIPRCRSHSSILCPRLCRAPTRICNVPHCVVHPRTDLPPLRKMPCQSQPPDMRTEPNRLAGAAAAVVSRSQ